MKLEFRIRSWIFPEWIYSSQHWEMSYFWQRWEGQYIDKPDLFPEMERLINDEWISVYYIKP